MTRRRGLTKSKDTRVTLARVMHDNTVQRPTELWSQGRAHRHDAGARKAATGTPNRLFAGVSHAQEQPQGRATEPAGSDGTARADARASVTGRGRN